MAILHNVGKQSRTAFLCFSLQKRTKTCIFSTPLLPGGFTGIFTPLSNSITHLPIVLESYSNAQMM